MMKYLSVCSGIEAASVAWSSLGWKPFAFSEIEKFPSAVLAHHYPHVPNLGDMTKFKDWPDAAIDLLVGGTPCQSFSVAGLRKGLADPRGNLALTYLGLVDRYRPEWIVWENVPGVLSSSGGRDFGAFLGGLAELGYGFAYRVLDAQYVRVDGFGRAVPQRRRRVFVVGNLGIWRRAAAVLFERESLSWDSAPRREAGERVAPTISARPTGGGGLGTDFDCDGGLVAASIAPTLNAAFGSKLGLENQHIDSGAGMFVAHALRGREGGSQFEGPHDTANIRAASGGSSCSYVVGSGHASTPKADAGTLLRGVRQALGEEAFAEWGLGILDTLQPTEVLRSVLHGCELRPATFSRRWLVHCALSREKDRSEGAMQSLREAKCARRSPQGWQPPEQLARELGTYLSQLSQPGAQAQRFMLDMWSASEGLGILRQALSAVQEARRPTRRQSEPTPTSWAVRRLVPEECEFLQGFPRGYTNILWRGKDSAPDGLRYKSLGNSMSINVMRWIGTRIQMVDDLMA